jgi:hypothetical protein
MPPIFTYSFFPGLDGSCASVQISFIASTGSSQSQLTYVIRPLQFYRKVFVTLIIGLNALDDRNRSEILNENNWRGAAQLHGMLHTH